MRTLSKVAVRRRIDEEIAVYHPIDRVPAASVVSREAVERAAHFRNIRKFGINWGGSDVRAVVSHIRHSMTNYDEVMDRITAAAGERLSPHARIWRYRVFAAMSDYFPAWVDYQSYISREMEDLAHALRLGGYGDERILELAETARHRVDARVIVRDENGGYDLFAMAKVWVWRIRQARQNDAPNLEYAAGVVTPLMETAALADTLFTPGDVDVVRTASHLMSLAVSGGMGTGNTLDRTLAKVERLLASVRWETTRPESILAQALDELLRRDEDAREGVAPDWSVVERALGPAGIAMRRPEDRSADGYLRFSLRAKQRILKSGGILPTRIVAQTIWETTIQKIDSSDAAHAANCESFIRSSLGLLPESERLEEQFERSDTPDLLEAFSDRVYEYALS